MLEVRFHASVREIPREDWDALAGPTGSPFVSWTWLDALESARCASPERGWTPHHASVRDGERLVALAPAYVKSHSEGEFVFDWSWAELAHRLGDRYYPKLVFAVPFTPATGPRTMLRDERDRDRVTAALATAVRDAMEKLSLSSAHVLFPTAEESAAWQRAGLVERLGVQYQWRNEGWASWDEFLGRFDSKRRNQLRRERKELAKQGIDVRTVRGAEIDEAAVDAIWRFYVSTVDKFVWGRRYLSRAFFCDVCDRMRDHVELVLARAGGAPIAGAFNVAGDRVLYGRYWGATEERPFLHFNVCYYHSIEECIARGFARFEPGAGGEHKRVRGFDPTLTRSVHLVREPRLDRAVRSYLARERAAVLAEVDDARAELVTPPSARGRR